jgi:transcriptional regulator with XRE-family HTH domain
VPNRDVKLGEMLGRLIKDRGYDRNRKKISTMLDISPAALSQYENDLTKPSFAKLVAMAEFFDVSLDYLVYGQPARSAQEADYEPTRRFVDFALSEVQARTSRHSAIVARIGRVLADRIDNVAQELVNAPTSIREGLVQDDELVRLENCCLQADVLSLDLGFDVIAAKDGIAAGRFLDVVAKNLESGTRYRFLIPGQEYVPDLILSSFRSLLAQKVGGDQVQENCAFRRTDIPLMTGAVLYRLDIEAMQETEPALYAQFSADLDEDYWFGCVIRSNADSNSDMMLDANHLRRAKKSFDKLWKTGEAA